MKEEILNLDRNTSTGYDGVSAIFLIECADELCYPLSAIYNLSVESGEYPSVLKFNNIIPIYKNNGEKSSIESYRPISIQPVISKLFERIVNSALRNHVKNMICDQQHGFCRNKSTTSNLLCYTDFISTAFDDGFQVHSIYTDFSKAFDTVSHSHLLLKMENYFGISNTDLKWFRSYLQDRFQRVVLHGFQSDWSPVFSGVPQGSILGPMLFIMYVNDMPSCLRSSNCLLFADDIKIFKRISCEKDCLDLQKDLSYFCDWCTKWNLKLNIDKCFSIDFSLKRVFSCNYAYTVFSSTLQQVHQVKDLGVFFLLTICRSLYTSRK